jgi:hypothetical protein
LLSKIYVLENLILLVLDGDVDKEIRIEYQCHIDDTEQ